MGKATGYCKGRSGSMHIADFSKGNLGANAIVGGGIPIATGGGLAIKMQGRQNVSVAFFGDGASNQGTFHESINLASVWKLPVIYVCENNQFGMTVPTWQSTSVENIADRAAGYGIPGEVVDGNDVCAVYEAFARAKARALKGEGPTLLECKTYRWRGHWTGDPEPYRTREEVEEWKEKKDPIKLFRAYLTRHKLATRQELDDIEAAAAKKMEAAVDFAMNSRNPIRPMFWTMCSMKVKGYETMAKLSYSQAIRETIAQEMRRDERVFVMGEDVEKLGGVYAAPGTSTRNSARSGSATPPSPSPPSSALPWAPPPAVCAPSRS